MFTFNRNDVVNTNAKVCVDKDVRTIAIFVSIVLTIITLLGINS